MLRDTVTIAPSPSLLKHSHAVSRLPPARRRPAPKTATAAKVREVCRPFFYSAETTTESYHMQNGPASVEALPASPVLRHWRFSIATFNGIRRRWFQSFLWSCAGEARSTPLEPRPIRVAACDIFRESAAVREKFLVGLPAFQSKRACPPQTGPSRRGSICRPTWRLYAVRRRSVAYRARQMAV
jgi:hypothetical protein